MTATATSAEHAKSTRPTRVRVSIRLRLTLWNTSVLALLLIVFAIAGLITLRRVLDERGDAAVRESASAIARALVAERRAARSRGDSAAVARVAARDVLRELRVGDLDVIIVDDAARVVAANRVPTRRRAGEKKPPAVVTAEPVDPDTTTIAPAVRELLRLKPTGEDVLVRSLTIDDIRWRAALVRVDPGGVDSLEPTLIVSVLRSDEEDLAVEARVRTTLLFAIPFALVLTVLAGYALARRSLAPVDEMAESAARISAATLSERLRVSNPHDELGRLAQVINDLLGRVDDAFRAQKQFVADASHELRTPIAIVRGEADVTLQRPTREEPEYREALAVIHDESVRLTRIVDDLFLLARADAASPLDRRERVDVGELIATGMRSVRTIADERGIALEMVRRDGDQSPVIVDGDPALLRRLLLNLLDNALKHTPSGGRINVSMEPTPTRAEFCVTDAGPGVPVELRPRIFDRFVRHVTTDSDEAKTAAAGTSRVPTASGAGLGLAIAQAIAHAHGGQIMLDESQTGAAFRVSLPRS